MPQNQNRVAPNARSRGKKFVIAGGVLGGVGLLVGVLFTIIQLSSPTTPDLIQGFTYIMICFPLPLIIIGGILLSLGIVNLRRSRNLGADVQVSPLPKMDQKTVIPPPITGYVQPPSTISEIRSPVTKATTNQIPPVLDPLVQMEKDTPSEAQIVEALIKALDGWYRSMDEYEGDNNPDYSAISPAEQKLKEIGIPAVVPLISSLSLPKWNGDRPWPYDARFVAVKRILVAIGSPLVDLLITKLKDESHTIRSGAAYALGEFKEVRAVTALIAALKDESEQVRSRAARALGELKDERAVIPLIAVLKDESEQVLSSAAQALGELKDERAVEPLIAALKNESEQVRSSAARALGKLKDWRAVEPLIAALKDESEQVRSSAARALGELQDGRAVDPLIAALKDQYQQVRRNAAGALGELKDERAVDPLIKIMNDLDHSVRSTAETALKKLGWQKSG